MSTNRNVTAAEQLTALTKRDLVGDSDSYSDQTITVTNLKTGINMAIIRGADINEPLVNYSMSPKPRTLLDVYQERFDINTQLAQSDDTDGVAAQAAAHCEEIVNFLRDKGAKTAEELDLRPSRSEVLSQREDSTQTSGQGKSH